MKIADFKKRVSISPAMLVALLALFVATSSSATAALMVTGKNIDRNAVASKHIKRQAIKPKHLSPQAKRQLAGKVGAPGAAGAPGAVGPRGESGAVGATGLTGPQGLTGAQGAQGATGATGATGMNGVSGFQVMSFTRSVPTGNTAQQFSCPVGKVAINGAHRLNTGSYGSLFVEGEGQTTDPRTWSTLFRNTGSSAASIEMTIFCITAN